METVVIKGNLDITQTIYVPSYTYLDLSQAYLELTANVDMFRNAGYGVTAARYVTFYGGEINGNKATRTAGSGIRGTFYNLRLLFIRIVDFYEFGLWLTDISPDETAHVDALRISILRCKAGEVKLEDVCDSTFIECYFISHGNNGVEMTGNTACNFFQACHFASSGQGLGLARALYIGGDFSARHKIIGCEFENYDMEAILIQPSANSFARSHVIEGNTFYNIAKYADNTYSVIKFDGSAGGSNNAQVKYNVIIGNTFYSDVTNKAKYNIELTSAGSVQANHIYGNYFGGYATSPVYVGNPPNYVKFNGGFKTENSGTATIPNGQTSVTFAHGLAGTPTIVTLGAKHAEVADAIWSADATNITITVPSAVTANRNISWYAEYKP